MFVTLLSQLSLLSISDPPRLGRLMVYAFPDYPLPKSSVTDWVEILSSANYGEDDYEG